MAHVFEKKWRSQDVRLGENVDFSALLLSERVIDGLNNARFKKPSPVQLEAIPMGRFGKDLMVQAKSGTGKTLVFVIVALEMLKRKLFRPQVLIIVPTREIATQICSVVKAVGSSFPKLICSSFIGGLPLFEDKEKAVTSQIIVGTPGRLRHLVQLKALPTNSIRLLVFDEADELLECASFTEDIEEIFNVLPDDKQVIATSATFSPKNRKLMLRYLRDPHLVRLNAKELALLGMVHYAEVVEFCPMPVIMYRIKLAALEKILKTVKFAQCLLFCNGVQRVEILYKDIKKWGFSVAYISSAKEQCDRLKAIDTLKRFKCKVLVSSDLTSRGIDAENVDLVINFDLSFSTEVYMHRVGRAGRYGTIGVAASIITSDEISLLQRIEKEGSFKTFKLPDPLPEDLILYPPQGDFVINETDFEDADCSEVKKCVNSKKVKRNSAKTVNLAKVQLKSDSENNVNIVDETHENILANQAVQSASDEIQIKTVDSNEIAHSNFKVIKTVSFNEETIDKKTKNESLNNNSIDLDENKESALLDECDQNELINNESVDIHYACNIISENPSDLCDTNVFGKQDIINDDVKKDVQLDRQFSNDLEKCNFETNNKQLYDIDNAPESLETKDIRKTESSFDSANCEQENNLKSDNTLNNMIQAFIDTYESNKIESTELKTIPNENLSEVSGKKLITVDTINNLKSQKNEFFYKILKEFQEGKDGGPTAYQDSKDQTGESAENDIALKNESNSITNLINKEINDAQEESADNFKFEGKKKFPEKPNFESTPLLNDKIRKENTEITVKETVSKPVIENKLVDLFQELSEDSRDSDSSESLNEVGERNSPVDDASVHSGSESSSPTSVYSEVESDSEAVSSSDFSVDEDNADVYHHDYSSTGRQNPSLISNSSRHRTHRGQISAEYPQNHQCSCGAIVQCKPQQDSIRSPDVIQGTSRDRRQRIFDQNSFVPFDYRDSRSCSGGPCRDFVDCDVTQRRRRRPCPRRAHQNFVHGVTERSSRACSSIAQQNFGDNGVAQSYFSKNCSRCCRSRISSNATRTDVQNRIVHPPCQRSSRHHHTRGCFMPTAHRCHPNTPDYPCSQGEICEMWYKTFYDQWLHIQNVINN